MLGLQRVPYLLSQNSGPQEWHKPRADGIRPEKLEDLSIRKPKLKDASRKRRIVDGVRSSLYNPLIAEFPPMEFVDNFQERMQTTFPNSQFAGLFPQSGFEGNLVRCKFGNVPQGCLLSYQQPYVPDKSKVESVPPPLVLPSLPAVVLPPEYSCVLTRKQCMFYQGLQVTLQSPVILRSRLGNNLKIQLGKN